MPIRHGIWTVGKKPVPLSPSRLPNEQLLEEMILSDPGILSDQWMLIGRQEVTTHGGRIDLLAITPDSSLVVIELKRDRTPREIVAQALDYASWVEKLTSSQIADMYRRFSGGNSLDVAFHKQFGTALDEEELNHSHQIVTVAAELDDSTERIVNYLNARGVAINVLLFQVFEQGEEKLLSRAWLLDPGETQTNASATVKGASPAEPWNGEYYVSYGDMSWRSWDDARKYGFISAGGGSWYSQTLKLLQPGARVWVKIPGTGYVGVGRVVDAVCAAKDFTVTTASGDQPALEVLQHGHRYKARADDPEKTEYFVRVQWLDTVPESKAFNEVGLFGNQNTVCKPTTPKWRHTIERLKTPFPKWDN